MEGRSSRQEGTVDGQGEVGRMGRKERVQSRQEGTVDGQGEVGRMGRKERVQSRQEMGADGIRVGKEGQRIGQKGSADSAKVERAEGRKGARNGNKQTMEDD